MQHAALSLALLVAASGAEAQGAAVEGSAGLRLQESARVHLRADDPPPVLRLQIEEPRSALGPGLGLLGTVPVTGLLAYRIAHPGTDDCEECDHWVDRETSTALFATLAAIATVTLVAMVIRRARQRRRWRDAGAGITF